MKLWKTWESVAKFVNSRGDDPFLKKHSGWHSYEAESKETYNHILRIRKMLNSSQIVQAGLDISKGYIMAWKIWNLPVRQVLHVKDCGRIFITPVKYCSGKGLWKSGLSTVKRPNINGVSVDRTIVTRGLQVLNSGFPQGAKVWSSPIQCVR